MSAPLIIMAGGTGGHIFPALAVADEMVRRNVPVVWLGSKGGMEERIIPARGFKLEVLRIKGLRGKGLGALVLAPFKLGVALIEALRVVHRHQPRAVLGLGGFASGPGGIAAWLLRKPLFIHEQNAIPGMTNRWLARIARCVMTGFPETFRTVGTVHRVLHTGNPVRREISALPPPRVRQVGQRGALRLLVVGGSLGALKLNTTVPKALAKLSEGEVVVRHQCGERHLPVTRDAYAESGVEARIEPFIDNMAEAYGWADLVIARAGALTVAELIEAGVAAILVPYPYAVDDHQTANANVLVEAGAATLIADRDLTEARLTEVLTSLIQDRRKLLQMAEASAPLKKPQAAREVSAICLGERLCTEVDV